MDNPLIGPENLLGLPAPYWFLAFFKVFGFSLHMIPVNLWYAGSRFCSPDGSAASMRSD
jgi:hypothetical protein